MHAWRSGRQATSGPVVPWKVNLGLGIDFQNSFFYLEKRDGTTCNILISMVFQKPQHLSAKKRPHMIELGNRFGEYGVLIHRTQKFILYARNMYY